jgi:hypothetical protein
MRMLPSVLAGSLLLPLVGCERQPRGKEEPSRPTESTPNGDIPEITAELEEGLVDLVLGLQEHRLNDDGSQTIRAAGLHKGSRVGFDLILASGWKKAREDKDVPLQIHTGAVSFRRVGSESDAFLQALDELYGTKVRPEAMASETPFTGASLEGDPANVATGPVKIKLFYEKGGEGSYAELFANIDLRARRVEVREKDSDYRAQIVRALRRK